MDRLSAKQIERLIGKLPEADREFARKAFEPQAPLGVMEVTYFRLCGAILGGDLLRAAINERAEAACDGPPKRLTCPRCGSESRLMECRSRKVASTVGELEWTRPVYRCPTCDTWSPFDDELGVASGERSSPRLQELTDRFGIDMPFDEVVGLLGEIVEVAPSHFFARQQPVRSGEQVIAMNSDRAASAQRDSRAVAVETRAVPIGRGDTLMIVPDGTGIPMRHGSCNEAKAAVIYLMRDRRVDKDGNERLMYSREVAWIGDWETFARQVYAEALRMGLRVVGHVVVIGDCSEWIDQLHREFFPDALRIADFWHTAQYLGEAASEALGEGNDAAKAWFRTQRDKLKKGQVAAVSRALRALKPGTKRTDALRYLRNHKSKMRYDEYLADGLPIGSGAVEGRCKNLVGTRFKRTGSRWCVDTAQSILSLRVLYRNHGWRTLYPNTTLRSPGPRREAA